MEKTDARYRRAYLILEAALFFAIPAAELLALPDPAVKWIKFAAILANTVMALRLYREYGGTARRPWDNLMALALAVNCGADFFLTLLGGADWFVPGFGLFCTVELIYAVYLKPSRGNLAVRAVLFAFAPVLAWRLNLLTLPNLLGAWNLTLLGVNVPSAWAAYLRGREPSAKRFAAGLSLFLAGDCTVAVEIFTRPGTALHAAAVLLVWVYYLPAEVLLVLTYAERVRNR